MDNKEIVAYAVSLTNDNSIRVLIVDKSNFKDKLYHQMKYGVDKETMLPVQAITFQLIDGTHTAFKRTLYDTYNAQGISLDTFKNFTEYIAKAGVVVEGYDAETFYKTIQDLYR